MKIGPIKRTGQIEHPHVPDPAQVPAPASEPASAPAEPVPAPVPAGGFR